MLLQHLTTADSSGVSTAVRRKGFHKNYSNYDSDTAGIIQFHWVPLSISVFQPAQGRVLSAEHPRAKKDAPRKGSILVVFYAAVRLRSQSVALFLVREKRAENLAHDRDLGRFRATDFGSRFDVLHVCSPFVTNTFKPKPRIQYI